MSWVTGWHNNMKPTSQMRLLHSSCPILMAFRILIWHLLLLLVIDISRNSATCTFFDMKKEMLNRIIKTLQALYDSPQYICKFMIVVWTNLLVVMSPSPHTPLPDLKPKPEVHLLDRKWSNLSILIFISESSWVHSHLPEQKIAVGMKNHGYSFVF